jgi:hypothetical protein
MPVSGSRGAPRRRRGAAADLDFPALSPSTTLAVELAVEAPLQGASVTLQFALAYTTATGARLTYANGPNAGRAFNNANGLALRVHLFNTQLNDLGNFAKVNETMAKYFSQPFPARAAVGVKELPRGALVEADGVMFIG